MITQPPPQTQDELDAPESPRARSTGIGAVGRRLAGRPWIVAIVIIVLIVAIWLIVRATTAQSGTPHYLSAPVRYADISATVEETGTVNPVNEVNVGTQVSGTVNSLSVDYNSIVHKGEVLATLDATSFQAASAQAHGAYDAAVAAAGAAQANAAQSTATEQAAVANFASSQAALQKAQAQVALTHTTVARDRSLLAQGYISQSQLDTDVAADKANVSDLNAAQSAAKAAQAQIAVTNAQHAATVSQASGAQAQTESASGQVQQADYNLQRAVITSPIDGIVVSRAVSVGQTVAASFQTPTLFVIASSLKDMQVDTSVSEADVGQLRVGASAQITVPAYPNVVFHGTVQQVRVNPTQVSNVVTYDAIVAVHDTSSRLMPGMTADVVIAIATRQHVLAIPAAALLYRPTGGQGQGQSGGGAGAGGGGSSSSSQGSGSSAPIAGAPGSRATVWVLRNGQPARVPIVIGMSDGKMYEVRSGDLQEGDRVIVGQALAKQYSSSNPMGGPFGR